MAFSQFVGTFVLGKIFSPTYKKAADKMCKDCEPFIEKGSKVLDLGCGRGIATVAFKNYFQAKVFGVDVKDQRVFDFPFKIIDGKSLPFPNNYFDVVMINYVLHHADDPSQLLKEAKRVSKDKIIIHEDLKEKGISNIACWLHKNTYKLSAPFKKMPINFLNEKSWQELFNQLRLKIIFKKRLAQRYSWLYPAKNILFVLEK
jgi:ubiquinone/menaquinone biosynthesis C-methylase UbiE